MHRDSVSDEDLMRATQEGDEEAFACLVQKHRGWVSSLLYAFVRDTEHAEDLAQEVFCRVHRHAADYRAQGRFDAWLKRITVNLAKDYLRKRQQNVVSLPDLDDRSLPIAPFDPTAALVSEGLRDDVRQAIQSLSEPIRLALVMRYFGDMNVADIAWALQCPEGTVRSRIHYGLERIRRILTEQW
ncbi:MAG TPA: sigma-70 family RNA polymerase sigma factor, partial [Chthonomonadaceae bacterium]|nr:sigma-70 family RNA polymerase sigma factor [Chthonomonadaceae bacterium]